MNPEDISGYQDLSPDQMQIMNDLMAQSGIGSDGSTLMSIMGFLGFGMNILYIVFFITTAIGLYKIAKKLSLAYPWLAFVPLIQIYTLLKAAGYNFWKGIVLLFLYGILGLIVFSITIAVGSMAIAGVSSSLSGALVGGFILGIISGLLMVFIMMYFIYSGIARRTGQSTGTAVLMTLFPWCMLWIVANRMSAPEEKVIEATIITEEL